MEMPERYSMEADMKEEKELFDEIDQSVGGEWAPAFDPWSFNDRHKPLATEDWQLGEGELE